MTFIRHLPIAKNLSEDYINEVETFMPQWLESLIPYYKEAKENGDTLLALVNHKVIGTDPELYKKDGIGYCRYTIPGLGTELSFNCDKTMFLNWNNYHIEPKVMDYVYSDIYFTRLFNQEDEYSGIADACKKYFREITNDPDVIFDFGYTCYIYWDENVKYYIQSHDGFY